MRTLRETMEESRLERGRPETVDLVHQHTRVGIGIGTRLNPIIGNQVFKS